MWKSCEELNKKSKHVAGRYDEDGRPLFCPYYVRWNECDGEGRLEYTTDRQPEPEYPPEIFQTSAGEIDMCDRGEFEGYLKIGGKYICYGNFSKIFEYKGEKYVIDDAAHMLCATFRLIKVNDDGTVEVVYNADEFAELHRAFDEEVDKQAEKPDDFDSREEEWWEEWREKQLEKWKEMRTPENDEKYKLNMHCEVGLSAYYVGKDITGDECVFFLCSGHIVDMEKSDLEQFTRVQYLLIYNPDHPEGATTVRIDFPESVRFYRVKNIWTDGVMLAVGCDDEVIKVYLPEMDVEYLTELE